MTVRSWILPLLLLASTTAPAAAQIPAYQRDVEETPGQTDPSFIYRVVTTRVVKPDQEGAVADYLTALRTAAAPGDPRVEVYVMRGSALPTFVTVQVASSADELAQLVTTDAATALVRQFGKADTIELTRRLNDATVSVDSAVGAVVPDQNLWLHDVKKLWPVLEVRRRRDAPVGFPAAWHPHRWNETAPGAELHTVIAHGDGVVHEFTRAFESLGERNAWADNNVGLIEDADDIHLLQLRADLSRPAKLFPPNRTTGMTPPR